MTKQYKKDYFEDRKLKYEKNHGVFVHEFMFTEFSNRILGQSNVALNDLQKQLDLEIARAKAEEERIENKAHNELEKVYNSNRLRDVSFDTVISNGNNDNVGDIGYNYLEYNKPSKRLVYEDANKKYLGDSYIATYKAIQSAFNDIEFNFTSKDNFDKLFNIINVSNESFTDTPNTPIPYKYLDLNNNTNDLTVNDTDRGNSTLEHSLTVSYTAISQALHAINTLYMSNNTDSYTLNDQGNIIKNEGQTKLISNYNSTLMLIVSCLNELKLNLEKLIERVTALENK